jgi:hypothetical protein
MELLRSRRKQHFVVVHVTRDVYEVLPIVFVLNFDVY